MNEGIKKENGKKKILEIFLLILILFWALLFLVNYLRYTNDKVPIFSIRKITEYEDGEVKEYISLGYIYRIYNRRSIQKVEFVPFWVMMEKTSDSSGLPYTHKDYNVPENENKVDKYKGLLYYYGDNRKLIGTYKCINSERDCNKAYSGIDKYDIVNSDYLTIKDSVKIYQVYNKYAFIDDSIKQNAVYGEEKYKRTIYLFDIENNKIINRFGDIKDSVYDTYLKASIGDVNRYIVKDYNSNKWGIIKLFEDGNIEQVLPYEYDSINYDIDTGYYIMCKDNKWFIFDLNNNKVLSNESTEVIYDVWVNNNNTYYYKTGVNNSDNKYDINYKIFRIDGQEFLNKPNITEIYSNKYFVMFLNKDDMTLRFIDYSGEEKKQLQLYFTDMNKDDYTHPAFEIQEAKEDYIAIYIYQGKELKYKFDRYYIYVDRWK